MFPYNIQPLGDTSLLITYSHNQPDKLLNHIHDTARILYEIKHPAMIDVIPAFETIAIEYDVSLCTFKHMKKVVIPYLEEKRNSISIAPAHHRIPICYDEKVALDLIEMSHTHNLTPEEVIAIHQETTYKVALMGFLPGFPYLTGLDKRLQTPRKSTPRTYVSKGAVGIGGNYTGIYSLASPGGWNIIGQTPIQLFNLSNTKPFLFQPGDTLSFYAITLEELEATK
ncbi:5-oxoprolinase subunit PxpB [Bacillus suaedaesalsae]|uniref:5-oxoprolinase subunit PxpB n=1 Tax=Bacillus suaedaesalsae TaxID=2810349 RepID=A0ABS2DFL3_9BACI|nr:5-oxoprolinase subunit PxpB [Bacillus suaedaesalsae]MBM6616815.1 5-oxoprolinase subunit PxpB [Bacillus suaedaesalsae]